MQNAEIARLLSDVADLLEISAGNPFKVRAYRNAARTVADHPDPIAELVSGGEFDITELPGIGGGIAKEITALVETGTLPQRQQLVATLPPGLLDLLRISGLGPKRVKLFHEQLKVNSVADLKDALEKGLIAKLPGFGPKLLEKIREGVSDTATTTPQRMVLHEAEQYARAIVEYVKAGGGIDEIDVAGSFRRRKETIGDLDIVVTCAPAKAAAVIQRFGSSARSRRLPRKATRAPPSGSPADCRSICASSNRPVSAPRCSTSRDRRRTTSSCARSRRRRNSS